MDLKTLSLIIAQLAEEKGISQDEVLKIAETALAAAYKKEYGKRGQIIRAKFNPETGEVSFWQVKIVVDQSMLKVEEGEEAQPSEKEGEGKTIPHTEQEQEEEEMPQDEQEELLEKKVRFNPEKHIMFEEAKNIKSDVEVGEEIIFLLETKFDFGRIAAQTAKQVIIQRVREAEKEAVFSEYKEKEGEVLSGIVQRVERRSVYVDVGKTTGLLLPAEQIPGELYRIGQRLKVYLLKVDETPKGPVVLLSRAHPKMISKIFELEVPEIAAGTVIIKAVAREPGARSKIAVLSVVEGVDPIGSCVGQKGTRVGAVINELNGEKIDIIAWSEDDATFIANALAPVKVIETRIDASRNQAVAYVEEDKLSLAIGKDGQNVRLAAKLTGWKIDVRPYRTEGEGVEEKPEGRPANKESSEE